jgi:DNA polymerase I-like protein with 3'-5' exonuclease and polymerase domains
VLREIGGQLCDTLLEYRSLSKVLGTYGDSILEHLDDDGRMRPQYLQVVGTNTGRLASRNPNAQNFTPLMKPYVHPPESHRVFVHADLSQAELRYLAQVANDEPLRAAFARGDDVHVSTAASMFGFDAVALAAEDPDRLKHLRQIAKALNFGIAYGTGASALARSLSAEGSATTVEEAKELLAQYRQTYPGTARWAEERIAEIQRIRENTVVIDWAVTLRLARGFSAVRDIRRTFRRTQQRWPNAEEIAALHPERDRQDATTLLADIEWLLNYSAPVALLANGEPFTFASRTESGRRQQFNLHLDRLFLSVVVEAVADPSPAFSNVRRRFEAEHDIDLQPDGDLPSEAETARVFEDRDLRRRYVDAIASELGADVADSRLSRAARERVSLMVNAWRNAPIQGGVADIMLAAYGDLDGRLRRFPSAMPVQTVHDSVVVECDEQDADAVAEEVRQALEVASLCFCPDVSPKADVDIRTSLADSDVERSAG